MSVQPGKVGGYARGGANEANKQAKKCNDFVPVRNCYYFLSLFFGLTQHAQINKREKEKKSSSSSNT